MRIVVLGDFHMDKHDQNTTAQMIEDINSVKPDLVIPLGDFGTNKNIGLVEGLKEAFQHLSHLKSPIRPIIGNHDLHFEMGNYMIEKGTFAKAFMETFNLSSTYDVLEFPSYRLFFVCNDKMPEDIECLCVQECYISEEQLSWIEEKLMERPGIPCLFFSHAPIATTGLRDIPEVHIRSTNAYLNQNFNPFKLMELVKNYPEITMWFSAHYHLGHDHQDAYSKRNGTHFFTTGVHSHHTRDGNRHSRVIDILDDAIMVSTLDHVKRGVKEEPDWLMNKSITNLIGSQPEIQTRVKQNLKLPSSKEATFIAHCRLGDDRLIEDGMMSFIDDRYLLLTEKGYLWDSNMEHGCLMGSYHVGKTLDAACATEEYIIKAQSGNLSFAKSRDPRKYVRDVKADSFVHVKSPGKISAIHALTVRVFAIGIRDRIHIIELSKKAKCHLKSVMKMEFLPVSIKGDSEELYIIDSNRHLFKLNVPKGNTTQISSNEVKAMEMKNDVLLTIEDDGDNLWFVRRKQGSIVTKSSKNIHLPDNVVFKILNENSVVIKIDNGIYLYDFTNEKVTITELLSGDFDFGEILVVESNNKRVLLTEFNERGHKDNTYIGSWVF
ncbi:metallophosphoesterase family protein [Vallitalea okinawensis]|uniref:metallophosphoesterase family protein n=1 Tax=Vallitalea okinawensis TaxID=2078660 RepID=UPI000CFE0865|nr:metallophosphoesterase [Vallitalea okinawensis]